MKTFTYHVDGTDFTDVEAFGKAWKDAVTLAEQKHCIITRTVISVQEEYYAHGAFLSINGLSPENEQRAFIF